jgi:hypothetical protein
VILVLNILSKGYIKYYRTTHRLQLASGRHNYHQMNDSAWSLREFEQDKVNIARAERLI